LILTATIKKTVPQNPIEQKTNKFDILTLDFGNQTNNQNLIQDKSQNNLNINAFSQQGNNQQQLNVNYSQNNNFQGQVNYPQFDNNQFSKNNTQNAKQEMQPKNPLDDLFG